MTDYLENITKLVTNLELEQISPALKEALDGGEDPSTLLQAMSAGMMQVGEIFEKGEYFLADLVLAGEVMKEGLRVIEPLLTVESHGTRGTVVLCTVKGDVHDIGKNLVGNMLTSCGFRVVDLGVDVHEDRVVEAVRDNNAGAVGLSVLLTPMVQSISDVVSALRAEGLRDRVKIAIGGACTTEELAQRCGVDGVGKDPVEAVRIFEAFLIDTST